MTHTAIRALLLLFASAPTLAHAQAHPATDVQTHAATGIVLSSDPAHHLLTVSCDDIPGYMSAMEMPFNVRGSTALSSIHPGTSIRFNIVQHGTDFTAEQIQIRPSANLESEPLQAAQLSALHNALDPTAATRVVALGQPVPDFELTDQAGKPVRLSEFRGKAVALTFGYSRCPNPNYCFRLSNNLATVEKRFHAQAGKDFVLLTVAIDPEHDRGDALNRFASTWNADPAVWHFVTGSVPDVHRVAALFGMNFWSEEGLVTHSLHTVLIDRDGNLAANLAGNAFTARQLGDLLQSVINRK